MLEAHSFGASSGKDLWARGEKRCCIFPASCVWRSCHAFSRAARQLYGDGSWQGGDRFFFRSAQLWERIVSIQTRVHDSMLSSKVSSLTSWVWRELLHWTMDELRTMQEFFFFATLWVSTGVRRSRPWTGHGHERVSRCGGYTLRLALRHGRVGCFITCTVSLDSCSSHALYATVPIQMRERVCSARLSTRRGPLVLSASTVG